MLNATQLDEFHQNGYIIVPDLFDPNEMELALRAMEQIFCGQTFTDYLVDLMLEKIPIQWNQRQRKLFHTMVKQNLEELSFPVALMNWIG